MPLRFTASRTVLLGELGLDGRLRPVRGILPATLAAQQAGFMRVIVPLRQAERLPKSSELGAQFARGQTLEVPSWFCTIGKIGRTRRHTSTTNCVGAALLSATRGVQGGAQVPTGRTQADRLTRR